MSTRLMKMIEVRDSRHRRPEDPLFEWVKPLEVSVTEGFDREPDTPMQVGYSVELRLGQKIWCREKDLTFAIDQTRRGLHRALYDDFTQSLLNLEIAFIERDSSKMKAALDEVRAILRYPGGV